MTVVNTRNTDKTLVTYFGDGVNRSWAVPFDYLHKDFIRVTVDAAEVGFTWLNSSTIETDAPADAGSFVIIRRWTDAKRRLVSFKDGSILRAYDLDVSALQSLHISEEARDSLVDAIGLNTEDQWEARHRRIMHVKGPVEDLDAVNKEWVEAEYGGALTACKTAASHASTQATQAVEAAKKASASEQVAAGAASAANTANTTATAAAQAAGVSANSASTSASDAATSAVSASAAAVTATTKAAEAAESADVAKADASIARRLDAELLHVTSFGAKGDGASDDTAAIQAAITACRSIGGSLHWPAGTYKVTANLPYFHTVPHTGFGVVVSNGSRWYISPRTTETNTLYARKNGLSNGDGLSPATAGNNLQWTVNDIFRFWDVSQGKWVVDAGAGTWGVLRITERRDAPRMANPFELRGASTGGHPSVPTTVISVASGTAAVGIDIRGGVSSRISNVLVENCNGSTSSAGIQLNGNGVLYLENVHATNCYYGFTVSEHATLDVKGGVVQQCGYLNGSGSAGGAGIRALFHTKLSIGNQNAGTLNYGPVIRNCPVGILAQESVVGHVDWTTFDSCTVAGLRLNVMSRVNADGSSFSRCGVGILTADSSTAFVSNSTTFGTGANENSQNYSCSSSGFMSAASVTSFFPSVGGTFGVPQNLLDAVYTDTTFATAGDTAPIYSLTVSPKVREDLPTTRGTPKAVCFKAWGRLTGTAGAKRFQIRVGNTVPNVLQVNTPATASGGFHVEAYLVFTGKGSQRGWVRLFTNNAVPVMGSAVFADGFTADKQVRLECVVLSAGDSIVVEGCEVFTTGL